jgi:hypothetical protein
MDLHLGLRDLSAEITRANSPRKLCHADPANDLRGNLPMISNSSAIHYPYSHGLVKITLLCITFLFCIKAIYSTDQDSSWTEINIQIHKAVIGSALNINLLRCLSDVLQHRDPYSGSCSKYKGPRFLSDERIPLV